MKNIGLKIKGNNNGAVAMRGDGKRYLLDDDGRLLVMNLKSSWRLSDG